jgi:ribosomal protein S18 acetylase RimI-like enzyme
LLLKSWRSIFCVGILAWGLILDQLDIGLLPARYVRAAIGLLADAFQDDPIFCFHFPALRLRRKVLELFFGDVVRAHMPFNHVYAAFAGEALVGAAVWRPPNAAVSGLPAQLRGLITRYRLLALSPRVGKRLLRGFEQLEATHPDIPHWYLFFIGIDLACRGHGIGGKLMAPVLRAADAGAMPCYLETPFPQTLPFYRQLGYEVFSEPRPFAGAPQLWAMRRDPMS